MRVILYAGYVLGMMLVFVKPVLSLYVIGILAVISFIVTFHGAKESAKWKGKK